MAEAGMGLKPAGWQITATTISCDRVDDYVTVMVHGDWTYSCTWCSRYKLASAGGAGRKYSGDIKSRISRCQGPDCSLVLAYRDKLIAEETAVNK
jgi:hypothetical protein